MADAPPPSEAPSEPRPPSEAPVSPPPGRWAQARAVLVALHLFAITALAFPAPSGGMNRATWRDPTVQAEFATWRARLGAAGVEVSPEEFEDGLWVAASRYMAFRQAILDPFWTYHRYFGTWQSWRMFVAPHRYPARLHIDVERDGTFEPVYVARSDEHTWLRPILDHDRMRAATFRYAWPNYRGSWRRFAAWVAERAARDFPDATRVRLRYHKAATPTPEQVRADEAPEGRRVNTRVIALERLR